MKNSSIPSVQSFSRSLILGLVRLRQASMTVATPQYRFGRPSLKVGSRPPPMLPATCRMASSNPFQVLEDAIFSLKPWGNWFTLD